MNMNLDHYPVCCVDPFVRSTFAKEYAKQLPTVSHLATLMYIPKSTTRALCVQKIAEPQPLFFSSHPLEPFHVDGLRTIQFGVGRTPMFFFHKCFYGLLETMAWLGKIDSRHLVKSIQTINFCQHRYLSAEKICSFANVGGRIVKIPWSADMKTFASYLEVEIFLPWREWCAESIVPHRLSTVFLGMLHSLYKRFIYRHGDDMDQMVKTMKQNTHPVGPVDPWIDGSKDRSFEVLYLWRLIPAMQQLLEDTLVDLFGPLFVDTFQWTVEGSGSNKLSNHFSSNRYDEAFYDYLRRQEQPVLLSAARGITTTATKPIPAPMSLEHQAAFRSFVRDLLYRWVDGVVPRKEMQWVYPEEQLTPKVKLRNWIYRMLMFRVEEVTMAEATDQLLYREQLMLWYRQSGKHHPWKDWWLLAQERVHEMSHRYYPIEGTPPTAFGTVPQPLFPRASAWTLVLPSPLEVESLDSDFIPFPSLPLDTNRCEMMVPGKLGWFCKVGQHPLSETHLYQQLFTFICHCFRDNWHIPLIQSVYTDEQKVDFLRDRVDVVVSTCYFCESFDMFRGPHRRCQYRYQQHFVTMLFQMMFFTYRQWLERIMEMRMFQMTFQKSLNLERVMEQSIDTQLNDMFATLCAVIYKVALELERLLNYLQALMQSPSEIWLTWMESWMDWLIQIHFHDPLPNVLERLLVHGDSFESVDAALLAAVEKEALLTPQYATFFAEHRDSAETNLGYKSIMHIQKVIKTKPGEDWIQHALLVWRWESVWQCRMEYLVQLLQPTFNDFDLQQLNS